VNVPIKSNDEKRKGEALLQAAKTGSPEAQFAYALHLIDSQSLAAKAKADAIEQQFYEGPGSPSPLASADPYSGSDSHNDHNSHSHSHDHSSGVNSAVSSREAFDAVRNEIKVIQTRNKSKKRARKAGVKEALINLDVNEDPLDVDIDYWLAEAGIRHNYLPAKVLLANRLMKRDVYEDAVEAIDLYTDAAAEGHADAAFNLGNLYFHGHEVGRIATHFEMSLKYFHLAAHLRDASALYWLGHCYISGEGGVDNVVPSKTVLLPGYTNTSVDIGGGVDVARGVAYMQNAASLDHPAANYYIATLYHSGVLGNPSDRSEQLQQFRAYIDKACSLGDGDALNCLASMYLDGSDGVMKDLAKAIDYFIEAIDAGHADAALTLGAMYYSGNGILPRDKSRAFELYNLAAERGCKDAWRNVAAMHAMGDGVPKSEETAKHIMKVIFNEDDVKFIH
jgi:TPR repeat protein